jgi:hypothetical protein
VAKVINLRTARKQRGRAEQRRRVEQETAADPGELDRARAEAELERRRLEGHRLDEPEA